MRIALVYAHFNLTGSLPRQHVELTRYLVSAGHDVHVYSIADGRQPDLVPGVRFHDVHAAPASDSRFGLPLHAGTFAWSATRMIARARASYDVVHGRGMSAYEQDIVHITGVVEGELNRASLARGEAGIRERLTDVLLPINAPIVPLRKAMERRILTGRVPVEVHTDSGLVREDLLQAYKVNPARVVAVPPGVNLAEFRPTTDLRVARQEIGLATDDALILFCGHSWERKGLDRAVRALGRMQQAARLLVVGQGDPGPYTALAREVGVAERIHFAGARNETWRFFQAADVFILPTRVDLWGMTVVEAMATGIPPITTTGAGVADVIVSGETGFVLAEPLDVDLLAQTLDSLVADPELRRRIGLAARQRARTLSWDEHGRQVEAAMLEVAAARRHHK